jgi:NAD(P)-dependent dehydrogenase (short-subunit alcohol dehydrogenase family)
MADGVLVAGGTGALGTAVVQDLLANGYDVTATWLVERERDRVQAALGDGRRVELIRADLTDPDEAARAVDHVGDLAAIVNLVGGYRGGVKIEDADPDDFERLVRLNLRPGVLLARAGIPRLVARGGGAFVGVSARAAVRPFAGAAAYASAKAAVLAFVRALDAEYGAAGVRCNAILPSVIDTPANRAGQPEADWSRWVQPAEIAAVIRFLVSNDSAPLSGAAVPVYGRA